MQLRTVLTLVNLAAFVVAITMLEVYPQYAEIAFYALVAWMVVSLALLYGRATRPAPSANAGTGGAGGLSVSADTPLASTSSPSHASTLGFCIYCAAPIEPNAARCAACGHTVPILS